MCLCAWTLWYSICYNLQFQLEVMSFAVCISAANENRKHIRRADACDKILFWYSWCSDVLSKVKAVDLKCEKKRNLFVSAHSSKLSRAQSHTPVRANWPTAGSLKRCKQCYSTKWEPLCWNRSPWITSETQTHPATAVWIVVQFGGSTIQEVDRCIQP